MKGESQYQEPTGTSTPQSVTSSVSYDFSQIGEFASPRNSAELKEETNAGEAAANTNRDQLSSLSRGINSLSFDGPSQIAKPAKTTTLPEFKKNLPEPMNNYNIPDDPAIVQTKLHLLKGKYPTFANKSLTDMKDLLEMSDLFQSHFDGIEQVQSIKLVHSELLAQRHQLAQENITYKEELQKLRQEVTEQETLAESLNTAFSQLVHQQVEALRLYLPGHMLEVMKKETRKAETESEDLVSSFLGLYTTGSASGIGSLGSSSSTGIGNSSLEMESFIDRFLEKRKRYHHLTALTLAVENAERKGELEGAPLSSY